MSHYRAALRKAALEALAGAPALAAFARMDAWAQSIDPGQIPCFGVATPRESSSREGGATVHRVTALQVALKIDGGAGDIEDSLDALSLTVEQAVLPALEAPRAHIAALVSTSTSIGFEGARRIGTLLMEFSATRFTDAGSQD